METSLSQIPPFESSRLGFNGHAHTIGPSIFNRPQKPPVNRIEIPTQDGDFLELDVIDAKNNLPVIALFHGLEGSTDRYYIINLMHTLSAQDFSVVAVNFRSCGSKMNRKRRFYHSGETNDIAAVFSWMKQQFNSSAIGAVGFSLGGNALLKFLGENGNISPVKASVAVSVPYDLKTGSLKIGRGINKIYQHQFLKTLTAKLDAKRQTFNDLPAFSGSTLYDFDDQITGPIHGFKNAEDYYVSCSSKAFINSIKQATLLIHSREDPLCPVDDMPMQNIRRNPAIDYVITNRGGHVGFWSTQKGWLNQIIANYFHQKID